MRGSTTARGYGHMHQQNRRALAPAADRGRCFCGRCGERILSGVAWDLDHTDDRRGYLGASHRFKADCPAGGNRATVKSRRRSREW